MRLRALPSSPRLAALAVLVVALAALGAGPAGAAVRGRPAPASTAPRAPVTDVALTLIPARNGEGPAGWVAPERAVRIAKSSAPLLVLHRTHHPLRYQVYIFPGAHYEVYFWYRHAMVADQIVYPSGRLGPFYTGPLMIGFYARGHYGDIFDAVWVWLPLGLLFLVPLVFLRGLSWLDRLDLAAVLAFGVSYALFDHRRLEAGVWMAYPPLLFLMGRMLVRGLRPQRARRERLRVAMPLWLLAAGVLGLVAARVGLTLEPRHVMDVGAASAVGAYKIVHGQAIYYASEGHGDTYGPIAYLAYVPFQLVWPGALWQTSLTSVRAATIAFDLLTIVALVLIGRRLRAGREGLRLGLALAWLWAACPFSAIGMLKSTNDGLIALLAAVLLLAIARPIRRGAVLALAAAAKFAPAVLVLLVAVGDGRGGRSAARRALAAFAIVTGASIAIFLPPGGIREMYSHTVGFQLSRADIFSPWALHPGLAPVKVLVVAAVAALVVLAGLRPRGPRSLEQVSALAAALTIGAQLTAVHWFYLYIVWFLPFVLVAVVGARAARPAEPLLAQHPRAPELGDDLQPALAGAL